MSEQQDRIGGPESAAPEVSSPASRWLAMAGVGMGVLMCTIDYSIVNIALPTLVENLHTDFATVQWVMISYVLVITCLMLGVARLGDMFGEKKLYLVGLVVFTLGSLLCGLAPGAGWLIAFRAFQGMGAALLQALGIAIVTAIFPARERGRALGVIGTVVAVGLAMGPGVGGLLLEVWGWRSLFLVNVPIGIISLVVVVVLVPHARTVASGQRFDLLGALVMLVCLACYALGMTYGQAKGFGDTWVDVMLISSLAALVLFVLVEKRVAEPMLEMSLFKNHMLSLNLIMGFVVFLSLGTNIVLPFYLMLGMGLSTVGTGLVMMVVPVLMGITAPWSGWMSDRYGPRGITLIGTLALLAGCLSMATIPDQLEVTELMIRVLPFGVGLGMFHSPNNSAVMGAAPRARLGVVSGLLSLTRTLGNTSGLPLGGAVFTACMLAAAGLPAGSPVTQAPPAALAAGLRGAYMVNAVIAALSVALAALAWRLGRHTDQTSEQASA